MSKDKFILTLAQRGSFCSNPRFAELDADKILLNNVILPREIDSENAYNPHNVRLWVIGHEHGPICAVWASHESETFDEACDAGMLESLQVSQADIDADVIGAYDDDYSYHGNAGEPHDLTHAWIGAVEFDARRDIQLIVAIVRAVENQKDTLGE